MRYLTMLLLIQALLLVNGSSTRADYMTADLADITVSVKAGSTFLQGAMVKLDLNNNGIWEEHLGEPQAVTGVNGIAVFNDIVSIEDPGHGGDDPADIIDWHPSRILTGNLRGAVGARDVQFDFVLPAGADRASLGLYDLRGRRLARTDGVGDLALDAPGGLSSGVYFVRLSAEPAAPVTHRITSVGQRARTVRARQVSAAEAVAAGWVESRTPMGAQKSRDDAHHIHLIVEHDDHATIVQPRIIVPGDNGFTVNMRTEPFVTVWDTGLGDGATVTLALAGSVDATIDWGDGTITHVTAPGPHTHDYGVDGVYIVSVTGCVTAYSSHTHGGPQQERWKLVSVDSWGQVGFTSLAAAFRDAANLSSVPADSDGIEAVINMSSMFRGASSFNHDIGGWDTSNVRFIAGMFYDASSFNQDLGGWDISQVFILGRMFQNASSFNGDLAGWDTSNVTDMHGMFYNASSFNRDIGGWDTSNVTEMGYLFVYASSFNRDIGGWDTSSVTDMGSLFAYATSFNQDLSGWCVELIPSEPTNFDLNATSWMLPRPVWGTCPD